MHTRSSHRRGGGRCLIAGCRCLFAPAVQRRQVPEPRPHGTVTVDASGVVLSYQAPPAPKPRRDRLERLLWRKIEEAGLPLPDELEYRFARAEGRLYRSDGFYRPNLLIEVDGGIWMAGGGGHSHPMHLESQHERDNLATLLGFRTLRFTEKMIRSGEAVRTIRRALQPAERLL